MYWMLGFIGTVVVITVATFLILNAKVNSDVKKCRQGMSGPVQ
jgi:hypothetical protein